MDFLWMAREKGFLALFCFAEGFASAEATRGLSGRPLDPFGSLCGNWEFIELELSSQVQQRIEENLKRGLPAEAFARSTVEFGNEGCYLSLAEVLHINRLGTVFTD